jgi:hypothetical protein
LEELLPDLGDKGAFRPLVEALAVYIHTGAVSAEKVAALRRHRPLCEVLALESVIADEGYLRDIASERPSQKALATEIVLRCEPLFSKYEGFLPALKRVL